MTMKLYFVRHATASRKSTWHLDDDLRPLTRSGRRRFRDSAISLVRSGALTPQRIVTSPLVRARQTAAILGKLIETAPIIEDWRLAHSFSVDDLIALIAENKSARTLAIVGHNPSLCDVLSQFVGEADLDLRKGAIACVDVAASKAGHGRLLWLVPPSVLTACDEPPRGGR
jgi:phosphohistidine phosphatase SixA